MGVGELVRVLADGGVGLVATDTVYGLCALPGSRGYEEIFRLKKRKRDQVLPWLVSGPSDLERYGEGVTPCAHALAKMFWPGALTLVVKASDEAKSLGGVAEDGTVALRMPDEESCRALLGLLGLPLACTSANLHGRPAAVKADELQEEFLALPHPKPLASLCRGGLSSTVVDCTGSVPLILREGAIATAEILAVGCLDATLGGAPFSVEEVLMTKPRLAIGCDHGGVEQEKQLAHYLQEQGFTVVDHGCDGTESVDYPDYARLVAGDVAAGRSDFGILVCGTGIGMAIAANKVKGIRAANITSPDFARLTRQHNNANVLTLSGRFVSLEENIQIVDAFLETAYEGGRHQNRLDKISQIEQEN